MPLKDLLENWALNNLTDREIYNDEYDRKIKLLIKDLGMILDIIDSAIVGSSSIITDNGVTNWSTPVVGEIGYMTSTDNTLAKARANAESTSRVYGVYGGTSTAVYVGGIINVLFEAGLTLTSGDKIYLSPTVAGRATNVAPSVSGQIVVQLGVLKSQSGYNSGLGSALPINWDLHDPITIP